MSKSTEHIFPKEFKILNSNKEFISDHESKSKEEIVESYSELIFDYQKLLRLSNKITSLGDSAHSKMERMQEELHKTVDKLKSTQDQLIHAEKMASLGELTSGIAHEIKNPLNFVTNFSEVSLELMEEIKNEIRDGNTEEVKVIAENLEENLKKIYEHGHRADNIVHSMLQHSKKSSGTKTTTELNKLVEDYVNFSHKGLKASKYDFEVQLNVKLDTSVGEVELYNEEFSRVIVYLCNNAFDAMQIKLREEGNKNYKPKLSVSTGLKDHCISIKISDNGVGISEDLKEKILQPFFTTKKGTEGTGLGLSITHDIIKAHGGKLNVISKEGDGATFEIELPL